MALDRSDDRQLLHFATGATVVIAPLMLSTLEEAYECGSFGNQEPTELRMTFRTRRLLQAFLQLHYPKEVRPEFPHEVRKFNQADIVEDPLLPDDLVHFAGSRCDVFLFLRG